MIVTQYYLVDFAREEVINLSGNMKKRFYGFSFGKKKWKSKTILKFNSIFKAFLKHKFVKKIEMGFEKFLKNKIYWDPRGAHCEEVIVHELGHAADDIVGDGLQDRQHLNVFAWRATKFADDISAVVSRAIRWTDKLYIYIYIFIYNKYILYI